MFGEKKGISERRKISPKKGRQINTFFDFLSQKIGTNLTVSHWPPLSDSSDITHAPLPAVTRSGRAPRLAPSGKCQLLTSICHGWTRTAGPQLLRRASPTVQNKSHQTPTTKKTTKRLEDSFYKMYDTAWEFQRTSGPLDQPRSSTTLGEKKLKNP